MVVVRGIAKNTKASREPDLILSIVVILNANVVYPRIFAEVVGS
jgi:hypothetical protein